MTFELPSGLPEGSWQVERDDRDGMEWNNHIVDARGNRICFMAHSGVPNNSAHEAAARAIASIPDMVEEIERLRAFNAALVTELTSICERLKKCAINSGTSEEYAELAITKARAILAEAQEPAS